MNLLNRTTSRKNKHPDPNGLLLKASHHALCEVGIQLFILNSS